MVVSHTLDGNKVPAEHLWWSKIPTQRAAKLTLKRLHECLAQTFGSSNILEFCVGPSPFEPSPAIPFLSQRFLGVR